MKRYYGACGGTKCLLSVVEVKKSLSEIIGGIEVLPW